jgi:hypothetical protein
LELSGVGVEVEVGKGLGGDLQKGMGPKTGNVEMPGCNGGISTLFFGDCNGDFFGDFGLLLVGVGTFVGGLFFRCLVLVFGGKSRLEKDFAEDGFVMQ